MTRRRALWLSVAAAGAVAATLVAAGVPRASQVVDVRGWRGGDHAHVARGAYHVHTSRSDGTGSLDEVARVAAALGLDFVIFSDHGDGRTLQPPTYRSGVLCLDAVEISSHGGHYVAIGMTPSSYPLGGDARDVVEDVSRLGGIGVVAHPDSAKRALAWADWSLPVDGFEWLSADSEWRDEGRTQLARALLYYAWRGPETVVSLFDRPTTTLSRWDEWGSRGRRLVGLAALDAHARLGPRGGEEEDEDDDGGSYTATDRLTIRVPSYDTLFRSVSTRVELERPLTSRPEADAATLIEGIRAGRVYTVLEGLAAPGGLVFHADGPGGRLRMGDAAPPGAGVLRITVRAAAPPGSRLLLRRNGVVVAETTGTDLEFATPEVEEGSAAYRVEVTAEGAPGHPPVPWIVSNPIYVGLVPPPGASASATGATPEALRAGGRTLTDGDERSRWHVEHDPGSRAEITIASGAGDSELALIFTLSSGRRDIWAAAAHDLERPLGTVRAVRFDARASRPLRFSVQVRAGSPGEDLRWRRSVYVDETSRHFELALDEFQPAGRHMRRDVPMADARGLLLVVDRPHTTDGTAGTLWVRDLRLVP